MSACSASSGATIFTNMFCAILLGTLTLSQIALVLVDEVHLLNEAGRGSALEAGCICRLKAIAALPEMAKVTGVIATFFCQLLLAGRATDNTSKETVVAGALCCQLPTASIAAAALSSTDTTLTIISILTPCCRCCSRLPFHNCEWQAPLGSVRFVAVSATIPNIADLARWLQVPPQGLRQYGDELRPCKLTTHVKGYNAAKNDFLFERRLNEYVYGIVRDYSNGRPALVFCK